jgi:hypothetical protein
MKFESGFVRILRNTALAIVTCAGVPVWAQQQTSAPPQSAQAQSSPKSQSDPQPGTQSQPGQPGSQAQGQAQSQANPTNSTQQQEPQKSKEENKTDEETKGVSNDRLFYALPNFLTISDADHVPPLSTGQKFTVVARSTFDWVEYPWNAFLAAISQAQDSEPGYGQGWGAYGKRFGAAFGDGAIENFWTGAIMPSVLKQDPRFYQSGEGGIWHRTGYAMSRVFVTRTDSGHNTFNASEIFGSAIAAGISTYTYHPSSERTLSNTASVWGTQVSYDTLTFVAKEFWPDVHRKIERWRSREE